MSATDEYNAVITRVDDLAEPRPGPLAGKRLLVKDLIDTAGIRTTYGSRIYADHVPERTASCVQRLVDAGAVVIGKANLHEFAWGVTSQNPWYGTVRNPFRPGKTTGGSQFLQLELPDRNEIVRQRSGIALIDAHGALAGRGLDGHRNLSAAILVRKV